MSEWQRVPADLTITALERWAVYFIFFNWKYLGRHFSSFCLSARAIEAAILWELKDSVNFIGNHTRGHFHVWWNFQCLTQISFQAPAQLFLFILQTFQINPSLWIASKLYKSRGLHACPIWIKLDSKIWLSSRFFFIQLLSTFDVR